MKLFLDLETTGLDPSTDRILEVAAILLDDGMSVVLDTFERVIGYPRVAHKTLDPVVLNMHEANGLWDACTHSHHHISDVDNDLERMLKNYDKPIMCGNSIHFDRAFMSVHMPRSLARLHYRMIDCSSLNEMAKIAWPGVHARRPTLSAGVAHRAMADAEESLLLARYYGTTLVDGSKAGS